MALSAVELSRMVREGEVLDVAAIAAGKMEIVDGLEAAVYVSEAIADGAPVPFSYMGGWSLITAAAHRGNASVVGLLKQLGASPVQGISAGNPLTPMILAAEKGHVEVIKALGVEGNPDLVVAGYNAATKAMESALGLNGDSSLTPEQLKATLTALKEAGATLVLPALPGKLHTILTNALCVEPINPNAVAVLAVWKEVGGSMDLPLVDNTTLLNRCMLDKIAHFPKIVAAGFGLNQKDQCGFHPVHYAINNGMVAEATALLQAGANPDVMTPEWHFANDAEGAVSAPMSLEALVEKNESGKLKSISKGDVNKAIADARAAKAAVAVTTEAGAAAGGAGGGPAAVAMVMGGVIMGGAGDRAPGVDSTVAPGGKR